MDFQLLHDLTQVHGRSHIPPRRAGDSRPAPAVFGIGGAVAQLGERYVRNVEVVGSIPSGSTKFLQKFEYHFNGLSAPEGIGLAFDQNVKAVLYHSCATGDGFGINNET